MSTVPIPKILANFETSLAATMSSSATTLTLNRSTDADGNTLSGLYSLTFDEGTTTEEHMTVTLAGAAGTVSRRGLSRVDGYTEVTANKFRHERGGSVKVTSFALLNIQRLLNGTDTFNAVDLLGINSISNLATPTSGETTKAANVAYVNAVSIAGASDASEVGKGIVEMGTAAQATSGTATGETGAPLTLTPARIAAQIQSGSWLSGTTAGTASAMTATLTPTLTALSHNMIMTLHITTANNAGCTLNVDGLGAKAVYKYAGNSAIAVEANDMKAGYHHVFLYDTDATVWLLVNPVNGTLTSAMQTEVQDFFNTTAITGGQATTLVSGSTSNADSLHYHNNTARGYFVSVMYQNPDRAANQMSCGYSVENGVEYLAFGSYTTAAGGGQLYAAYKVATEYGVDIYQFNRNINSQNVAAANVLYADGHYWTAAPGGGTTAYQDGTGVTFGSNSCSGAMSFDKGNSRLMFLNTTTNVRRFTYSGTTLTFVDNITLDTAVTLDRGWVFDDTNDMMYFIDTTANLIRKFNMSGVTQSTTSYSLDDARVSGIVAVSGRIHITVSEGVGESSATASADISAFNVRLIPTTIKF